jgi:hypothetical protein
MHLRQRRIRTRGADGVATQVKTKPRRWQVDGFCIVRRIKQIADGSKAIAIDTAIPSQGKRDESGEHQRDIEESGGDSPGAQSDRQEDAPNSCADHL